MRLKRIDQSLSLLLAFSISLLVLPLLLTVDAQDSENFSSWIAYQGGVMGPNTEGYTLYLMLPDGSSNNRLLEIVSRAPSWSPDGSRIAFAEVINSEFDIPETRISVLDVLTRQITPLTTSYAIQPVWSPDGNWIAYSQFELPGRMLQLILVRPDGSESINLTERSGLRGIA